MFVQVKRSDRTNKTQEYSSASSALEGENRDDNLYIYKSDYYLQTDHHDPVPVCRCLRDFSSGDISPAAFHRKQFILSTVSRTQNYLIERRIPELITFLLAKLISEAPNKPAAYLSKLLDNCMIYRSGIGQAPVLYERRHLEAIIKSFDPGNRGWLSAGQVKRAYYTVGLVPEIMMEGRIPTKVVLNKLEKAQKDNLFALVAAGSIHDPKKPTSYHADATTRTTNSKTIDIADNLRCGSNCIFK